VIGARRRVEPDRLLVLPDPAAGRPYRVIEVTPDELVVGPYRLRLDPALRADLVAALIVRPPGVAPSASAPELVLARHCLHEVFDASGRTAFWAIAAPGESAANLDDVRAVAEALIGPRPTPAEVLTALAAVRQPWEVRHVVA
jgi:hypothetical protein